MKAAAQYQKAFERRRTDHATAWNKAARDDDVTTAVGGFDELIDSARVVGVVGRIDDDVGSRALLEAGHDGGMRAFVAILDENDVDRRPLRIGLDRGERVVVVAVVADEDAKGGRNLRAELLQHGNDVFTFVEHGDDDIEACHHSIASIQRPSAFERRATSIRCCTR